MILPKKDFTCYTSVVVKGILHQFSELFYFPLLFVFFFCGSFFYFYSKKKKKKKKNNSIKNQTFLFFFLSSAFYLRFLHIFVITINFVIKTVIVIKFIWSRIIVRKNGKKFFTDYLSFYLFCENSHLLFCILYLFTLQQFDKHWKQNTFFFSSQLGNDSYKKKILKKLQKKNIITGISDVNS